MAPQEEKIDMDFPSQESTPDESEAAMPQPSIQIPACPSPTRTPPARPSLTKRCQKQSSQPYKGKQSQLPAFHQKNTLRSPPKPARIPSKAKVVAVPASLLFKEWTKTNPTDTEECYDASSSDRAVLAMKNADFEMKKLRECFTVQGLQKASIRVSYAILAVAEEKACHNPFLCLHQAAVFAGHGSKGGNNDIAFKAKIPRSEDECSPFDALLILGRAECLASIAFTDEAMYLCSYVAKTCHLHRDNQYEAYPWNGKWRIIGIQTYMVYEAINTCIENFLEEDVRKGVLEAWSNEVVQEVKLGRTDAVSMMKKVNQQEVSPDVDGYEESTGLDEDEELSITNKEEDSNESHASEKKIDLNNAEENTDRCERCLLSRNGVENGQTTIENKKTGIGCVEEEQEKAFIECEEEKEHTPTVPV